ncbi:transmembrane protein 192-like [Branchiostoma floridae x Branchiostoma japonicum]
MVSLGSEGSRQGAYFFDQEASLTSKDEELLVDQTLSAESDPEFHPICTVWAGVTQAVLVVAFAVACFVLPELDISISILVYCQTGLWFLTFLLERYMRYQHFVSRRNGYLEFYRQTKDIRRLPFIVISAGSSLLLALLQLLADLRQKDGKDAALQPDHYIQVLAALELVVTLPCLILYLVRTVRFNRSRASPDVQQDELGFLQSHVTSTEVGFRDGDYLDEVLEKQADMIRYLQQHNAHLGRRILHLTQDQTQSNSRLSSLGKVQ